MEQLRRCACAHFICLPPFLPADFKEQAEPKVFTIMCTTHTKTPDNQALYDALMVPIF
jgi:hypothetical protein